MGAEDRLDRAVEVAAVRDRGAAAFAAGGAPPP
jgi:hypothetical protein